MFKNALIIAGGIGSRMRPLTDYTPKPLIKYNNRELISYNLNFLKTNGIENIIVTYGYKSDQLVCFLEKQVNCLINTIQKDNSYFLFNSIVKYIDEPLLLLPCDIIINLDLSKLYEEYLNLNSPSCLIVPLRNYENAEADFLHVNGNKITKINRQEESHLKASGIQIINPKKINSKITSSQNFYNVWENLIKKDDLYISNTNIDFWEAIDKFNQIK